MIVIIQCIELRTILQTAHPTVLLVWPRSDLTFWVISRPKKVSHFWAIRVFTVILLGQRSKRFVDCAPKFSQIRHHIVQLHPLGHSLYKDAKMLLYSRIKSHRPGASSELASQSHSFIAQEKSRLQLAFNTASCIPNPTQLPSCKNAAKWYFIC